MNTPPFLLGAAILFWGALGSHLALAVVLAIAFEAARFVDWRLEIGEARQRRVADLSTLLALGAGGAFYLAAGFPRAAVLFFEWLPVLLLPVAAMQAYGTARAIDLRVLFWSLRRRAPRQFDSVNLGYPYLILWVIAASATTARGPEFDAGLALIVAWALWPLRARARGVATWLALVAVAAALGFVGGIGLHDFQLWLEGAAPEWLAGGGTKVNPYRGTTDIGRLGQLKMSDAVVLRVRPGFELKPPLLLHQASYNDYVGVNWLARGGSFAKLPPDTGGRGWRLAEGTPLQDLAIDEHARHGSPVLSLPQGSLAVSGLVSASLKRNPLGAVQAETEPGFIAYRVAFDPAAADRDAPGAAERRIPDAERSTIEATAREWGLAGLTPEAAIAAIRQRFVRDFAYSTFQAAPKGSQSVAKGSATPLADFLLRTRAGHCEHFATATTLLLREAGVPARYASGYSLQEWSALEGAWVARERHSHAWSRAFVAGRWIDVDTTPPVWIEMEEEARPVWGPLVDAWSWARFRIARWLGSADAGEKGIALAIPLALVLLLVGRRVQRGFRASAVRAAPARRVEENNAEAGPGFPHIARHLAAIGLPRRPEETIRDWLSRIAPRLPGDAAELTRLAALHYRLRYDPAGLPEAERRALEAAALRWLEGAARETAR